MHTTESARPGVLVTREPAIDAHEQTIDRESRLLKPADPLGFRRWWRSP
jgi:hypothetical protein